MATNNPLASLPPLPPPPGGNSVEHVHQPVPGRGKERKKLSWRSFGGDGFLVSLGLHVALVLVALFWVVSTLVEPAQKEPSTFATGSGGGNSGSTARIFDHRMTPKNVRNLVHNPAKLVARGTSSSIALPEMPDLGMNALQGGLTEGGLSKGLGGGSGGGIGTGQGVGVGGGKNLVGKFVMGTRVQAQKIAVYLDSSGSMTPYLPRVKREIYEQFPDADIFGILDCYFGVVDGVIYMGPQYSGGVKKAVDFRRRNPSPTEVAKLTLGGQNLFKNNKDKLEQGSLGGWLEFMLRERYDALVVFADFQDGIYQLEGDKRISLKNRTRSQLAWERRLVSAFRREGAPKLYLFSIQHTPMPLLQECVKASRGEIKLVRHLRQR